LVLRDGHRLRESELTDVVVLDPALDRTTVLRWAALAEAGSEHPLARPIIDAAAEAGVAPRTLPAVTEPVMGKGIAAVVGPEDRGDPLP